MTKVRGKAKWSEPHRYLLMGFHWNVNEKVVTDLFEKSGCSILEIESKMK